MEKQVPVSITFGDREIQLSGEVVDFGEKGPYDKLRDIPGRLSLDEIDKIQRRKSALIVMVCGDICSSRVVDIEELKSC